MLDFIYELFSFDFHTPMLFNSGLFLFLFYFFLIGYIILYRHIQARLLYVIGFSLFFYYKSSGYFIFLFLGTIIITYYLALLIDKNVNYQDLYQTAKKNKSPYIKNINFQILYKFCI